MQRNAYLKERWSGSGLKASATARLRVGLPARPSSFRRMRQGARRHLWDVDVRWLARHQRDDPAKLLAGDDAVVFRISYIHTYSTYVCMYCILTVVDKKLLSVTGNM
jgi:hypothetical protein